MDVLQCIFHFAVGEHLSYFLFLEIINNAVIIIFLYRILYGHKIFFFFDKYLGVELLVPIIRVCLTL